MKKRTEVRLLPQAEEDFLEIIEYVSEDSLTAAEKMTQLFEFAFENLSINPMVGRAARENRLRLLGYRHLLVSPYLIFYRVRNEKILIHRILHGARDYLALLTYS